MLLWVMIHNFVYVLWASLTIKYILNYSKWLILIQITIYLSDSMVDLRSNVMNQFAKQTMSKAKEAMGIESTTASQSGQEGPINW